MTKRIIRPSRKFGEGWVIVAVVPDDYTLNSEERYWQKQGELRVEQVPPGSDPWSPVKLPEERKV